jgi:hypothetical protein
MKKGQKCRHNFQPYKKGDVYGYLKCKNCGKIIKDYEFEGSTKDRKSR